jgi:hypothetical protein
MDKSAVNDWLRIHRTLMEKEAAFTETALKAARGEVSTAQLEQERHQLLALRELCNTVYKTAFPGLRK